MNGDWSGLLVQFAVTAIVILALIALVYWLMRRYSAAGLGKIGRGRVPRLAIVDAMSVDGRRKLVLVRRDNVEHLLLIGGPSDVVVEQTIQRPRRPKPATTTAPTTELEAVLQTPEEVHTAPSHSAPPPPPPRTYASTQNGRVRASRARASFHVPPATPSLSSASPAPPSRSDAPSPARYVDVQRPTRIDTPVAAAETPGPLVEELEPTLPDLPTVDLPDGDEEPAFVTNGSGTASVEIAAEPPRPAERSPFAKPDTGNGSEAGGKLADLENEMARLLGEITQKRHS